MPTDESTQVAEAKRDRGQKRLKIASIVCLLFVIGEFTAGFVANSIAVNADAAHMLIDLMSFGVSLIALKLSEGKPSKLYTFGKSRAEVLGAMFSIVSLWIITAFLTSSAIFRLINPEEDINEDVMIYTAVAAIIFNIILGGILLYSGSGHMHSHGGTSHGHSHDNEAVNIKAAVIHIIGDLVQSVGVLVAGIVIKCLGPDNKNAALVDPITTLIFLVVIIFTTVRVMIDLVKILMNRCENGQYDRVLSVLQSVADDIHMLHIWTMVPGEYVITAHIRLKPDELRSEKELLVLTEEQVRSIEPGCKCLTIQVNCSCVHENYCHSIDKNPTILCNL